MIEMKSNWSGEMMRAEACCYKDWRFGNGFWISYVALVYMMN